MLGVIHLSKEVLFISLTALFKIFNDVSIIGRVIQKEHIIVSKHMDE